MPLLGPDDVYKIWHLNHYCRRVQQVLSLRVVCVLLRCQLELYCDVHIFGGSLVLGVFKLILKRPLRIISVERNLLFRLVLAAKDSTLRPQNRLLSEQYGHKNVLIWVAFHNVLI